jgi:hypothetical protein
MKRDVKGRFAKVQSPHKGDNIGVLLCLVLSLFIIGFFVLLGMIIVGVSSADATEIKQPCPSLESPHNPALDTEAQRHAEYMACVCVQGHQGFESRFNRLSAKWPGSRIAEICFEAWPWQAGYSDAELWIEAVKCWRQSPGHWSVACRRHKAVGIGLAKGRNDTWYGCLISVD